MGRNLFNMTHLGALYMANNQLSRIPPGIASLKNLTILDLSSNRLRIVPPELGLLLQLRHLYLQQNYLRTLPFELGRLYKITTLGKFYTIVFDLVHRLIDWPPYCVCYFELVLLTLECL